MIMRSPVYRLHNTPGSIASRCPGERLRRQGKKIAKKRISDYTFTMFQTFGVVIPNSPDSLNDPR